MSGCSSSITRAPADDRAAAVAAHQPFTREQPDLQAIAAYSQQIAAGLGHIRGGRGDGGGRGPQKYTFSPAPSPAGHPFADMNLEGLIEEPDNHVAGTNPDSNVIGLGDEEDAGLFLSKGTIGGGRGPTPTAQSGNQHSQLQSRTARASNKRKATDDKNKWSRNQRAKHHNNDYTALVKKNQWYPDNKEFHNVLGYLPHLWDEPGGCCIRGSVVTYVCMRVVVGIFLG